MRNYFITKNASDCCGCSACASVCPKLCIELKVNEEGFYYPIKDTSICIGCGLCEKVCPITDNYSYQTSEKPDVFSAYDYENRVGSSSGGIFYTLAKYVIEEKNGWVFGAAFDDSLKLHHTGTTSLTDLNKLRGSKYLQSEMGDNFRKIKKILKEENFVLFVGTPCQVAGLRSYLRKTYDNLLVVDLVCHGTPSQYIFDEHLKYLENKYKSRPISYSFRNNERWGGCEIVQFENGKKIKNPSYYISPYLYSFMYSYTYRESCYNCKFSKIPRQGDITLADFWGVSSYYPEIDTTKGISLVLVNTAFGEAAWESIKDNLYTRAATLEQAIKENGNLINVSKRPKIRDQVYKLIQEKGYDTVAKQHFRMKHYILNTTIIRLVNNPTLRALARNIKRLFKLI